MASMVAGRGGMSRAAAMAMGGLAVLCCLFLIAVSSSDTQSPTALMHVGPLAQAQTAMAAADVKQGGSDILPDVDDLDVDAGIGLSAPKSHRSRGSAQDGHAYHRSDDSAAMADELRRSAQHVGLLSARDAAVQKKADEAAESDLDKYNTGISASLDDYARISKSIDEQSRSVFDPKPKKHVKPAVDPFKEDESVWHQMGVSSHSDVYGVPREFRGMRAVSFKHAERSPDANLPDFVRRAQQAAQAELAPGEGDSVSEAHDHAHRQRHMQAEMARAATAARHRARTEGKAQQVVSLVRDAVQKALHDNLAKKEAEARKEEQHTLNAAFFPSPQQIKQQQQQQQAVWAEATPVRLSPPQAPAFASPATHANANARLPTPSRAEASLLTRERADREAEDQQRRQQRVAYVKQLAQAYEYQQQHQHQHHPSATRHSVASSSSSSSSSSTQEEGAKEEQAQDSAIRDGEAEEVAKLKAEVHKMREEQRVEALRRQVRKLRSKLHQRQATLHPASSSSSSSSARKHSLAAAEAPAEEQAQAPQAGEQGGAGGGSRGGAGGGGSAGGGRRGAS